MTRNALVILFGIVPAAILSVVAIVATSIQIGMAILPWTFIVMGSLGIVGTIALVASASDRRDPATIVGLVLGLVAGGWLIQNAMTSGHRLMMLLGAIAVPPVLTGIWALVNIAMTPNNTDPPNDLG